ncbi:FMN-dependent 2-nitropropane dioxygenase [Neurospora intermedia]|uniref:FMN-dependent 2-nitropropane dioxygenase n=1 Tax=Neurospora intermedia TaxID=5142 RepID=A0ABR3DDH9_NEUIN
MHFPGHSSKKEESAQAALTKLNSWFPTTKNPVIISAPMYLIANGTFAAEVSKAGGIGFVAGGSDFRPGSSHLTALSTELASARSRLGLTDRPLTPLPGIGVGLILTHTISVPYVTDTVLPILIEHSPQAVWLFANDPDFESSSEPSAKGTAKQIIDALHASGFVVFFQVGTVKDARKAAADGADVIVAQGIDAGGHQLATGSGIVSLVPEVRDMLDREFKDREVVVVAAGGVADGRGVVGALGLGAEGVVLGTRFTVAVEASTPEFRRKVILETNDGGLNTVKSHFHDQINSNTIWHNVYDGRAVRNASYDDHAAGVPFEENHKKFKEAASSGDNSRAVTWSGTAVGLIKDQKPAGDIVRELREEAKESIKKIQAFAA